MTVTCTGAEFNEFMRDESVWQEGYWFDDICVWVNGAEESVDFIIPEPDDELVIEGGDLYHGPHVNSVFYSFEETLAKWLKTRKFFTLVVNVPNGKKAHVLSLLADIEGVIVNNG